jgi:hypothetical protein
MSTKVDSEGVGRTALEEPHVPQLAFELGRDDLMYGITRRSNRVLGG